jgi:hypothetical protein
MIPGINNRHNFSQAELGVCPLALSSGSPPSSTPHKKSRKAPWTKKTHEKTEKLANSLGDLKSFR